MPASLKTPLSDVAARIRKTTPRERLLLAGLVVGAVLYGLMSAADFRNLEEDRFAEALADRVEAQLARSSAARAESNAPDQMALEDLRSWGVRAGNVSIAQVRIESQLLAAANAAELANTRITTDDDLTEIGPTLWLNAEIETDLNWTSTFAFLEEVGRFPSGFRVVDFGFDIEPQRGLETSYEFRPPRGRIRMTLGFPVKIADMSERS
jgi:hypothetical protein